MEIIPVIDLMQGQVVRAKRGDRARYQPIASSLCKGSAPLDIVQALLGLYSFESLYIADLDAIQQQGDHRNVVTQIRDRYPFLNLMVDAGFCSAEQLSVWQAMDIHPVFGSENLQSPQQLHALLDQCNPGIAALSLDFSTQGFLGDRSLLDNPEEWPTSVILMTLARVGSHEGPDCDRLRQIIGLAGARKVFAAGGVRDMSDLRNLDAIGVAGALIASALHDGTIRSIDLAHHDIVK